MLYLVLSFVSLLFVSLLFGCTDAEWDKNTSLGSGREIVCYSGGTIIYQGMSSGMILSEEASDGYFFRDSKTGKFVEVSGDCVLTSGGTKN